MQRKYTVTINEPEGEDDFDFKITIGHNGMAVDRFEETMVPASMRIGASIMRHLEDNR